MRTPVITIALLMLLAACGGGATGSEPTDSSSTPSATGIDAFGDGAWRLVSGTVDGTDLELISTHPVTISLTEDGLGGTAACNSYFGAITAAGDDLTIGELGSTMMACVDEGVMDLEMAYLAALPRATSATVDAGNLVLSGEGVTLTFAPEVAAPDAELEGTSWMLESLVSSEAVSSTVAGTAATLVIANGEATGNTGCNDFGGPVEVVDGRLVSEGLAATEMACAADVMTQEAHVLEVLGAGPTVAIDGDTLTLTSDDGRALVYRAG
jgi:heat shock protein HslJ